MTEEYLLETRTHVDKIFKKLAKKNPQQMESIAEKIEEILADPHRFESLHFPCRDAQGSLFLAILS